MKKQLTRKDFIKKTSLAGLGVALGSNLINAKSYGRIVGANDRLNFAAVGVRSRGAVHIDSLSVMDNVMVTHVCDVDRRFLDEGGKKVLNKFGEKPNLEKDIRKALESKDIDGVTIATPEHWQAPMAIMALQAGKHVFLEKPGSHNPAEAEMILEAQKKHKKLIQLGNQQRSSAHTIEAIKKIHDGAIGRAYMGKAWYSNNRKSIGIGKEVPVPEYLDWELWQGPAPRRAYKDNLHPYNWHWFWHWGTGETLNNATHEVDVCRWALDVDFPGKVTSSGGRYHFKDDWEFYDTLVTSFEYDDKMITWEGKSCNEMLYYGRGRGATIHGTEGTVLIDRNGYEMYSLEGEKTFEYTKPEKDETTGLGGGGPLTDAHFTNFINAIRNGEKLNSSFDKVYSSVSILLLSNIAWKHGKVLELDRSNGRITNDAKAMSEDWSREYEPGWKPKV